MAQPANSAIGLAMSVHPSKCESQSSTGTGRGRGRESSSGGSQNRIYALVGRQDQESSPDVMTGMLTICSHDVYALIDPGFTLSCITPFVAKKFGIVPEILSDPFAVSIPVRESIIAKHVYQGYTISVCGRQTSADLVKLEILDFDAIMGMDWLAACYGTIDCQAKTAKFHFPSEPVLEWVGNIATPRGRFISYLKARKMIAKGCIYHTVRVKDVNADITTLQSILVVKEYTNVFPDELPSIPPKRKIDFGIDLLLRTQPISIPPYRMKATKFQWTQACEQSFQELKNRLTSAPVLALPEGPDGYAMYYDASSVGLGCVLMQHGKVIAYASRQ
ncbi:uncharacterized protein [Nicotiana sylvestris]|uniref:uncharacterized protein n=1 Tax=Nicotiana sylvestris TaxID=4096 RepID=UPI00388C6E05